MKFTLSEIKKNLQGNNSGVDEAENQINDMKHNKQKNQSQQKGIPQNEVSVSSL